MVAEKWNLQWGVTWKMFDRRIACRCGHVPTSGVRPLMRAGSGAASLRRSLRCFPEVVLVVTGKQRSFAGLWHLCRLLFCVLFMLKVSSLFCCEFFVLFVGSFGVLHWDELRGTHSNCFLFLKSRDVMGRMWAMSYLLYSHLDLKIFEV